MNDRLIAFPAGFLLILLLSGNAFAVTIEWTDWQTFERQIPPGDYTNAQGTIDGEVDVTYSGSAWSVLTNCSSGNYWTEPGPGPAPYTGSALIDNGPPCDAIRLNWATSNTVTFSDPVWKPLMAIVSLGSSSTAVSYDFGEGVQFSVLSEGQGMYGDGTYELGDGSITGNEFHGVIQFDGWVKQISWTPSTTELWHGFTFGLDLTSDTDGDGQSDVEELIAGSDHNNSNACFRIYSASHEESGSVISWEPCVTGRWYEVFWRSDLTNSYLSMDNYIEYPQNSYTDTTHNVEGTGFYRVTVELK